MPILHQGTHKCEYCNKAFDWIHFELTPQPLSSRLVVERIPDQLKVYRFSPSYNGTFNVGVNCPYCYFDNHFVFPEDNTDEK